MEGERNRPKLVDAELRRQILDYYLNQNQPQAWIAHALGVPVGIVAMVLDGKAGAD